MFTTLDEVKFLNKCSLMSTKIIETSKQYVLFVARKLLSSSILERLHVYLSPSHTSLWNLLQFKSIFTTLIWCQPVLKVKRTLYFPSLFLISIGRIILQIYKCTFIKTNSSRKILDNFIGCSGNVNFPF